MATGKRLYETRSVHIGLEDLDEESDASTGDESFVTVSENRSVREPSRPTSPLNHDTSCSLSQDVVTSLSVSEAVPAALLDVEDIEILPVKDAHDTPPDPAPQLAPENGAQEKGFRSSRQEKHNAILSRMRVGPILKMSKMLCPEGNLIRLGNSASLRMDSLGKGATGEVSFMNLTDDTKKYLGIPAEARSFSVFKRINSGIDPHSVETCSADERCLSLLREVRILLHDPIRHDPNIVDLYAVFFEPDQTRYDLSWPVTVMEYAEYGTLADLVIKPEDSFTKLGNILLGVIAAVRRLHSCFIAHQDIKPENILLCKATNGEFIPKLTDLAFAVFGQSPNDVVHAANIAGTPPWTAPHVVGGYGDAVALGVLMSNDIYSLALLALSLAIAGKGNPAEGEEDGSGATEIRFWERELRRRWEQAGHQCQFDLEERKKKREFLDDLLQLLRDMPRKDAPITMIEQMLQLVILPDAQEQVPNTAMEILAAISPRNEDIFSPSAGIPLPDMSLEDAYGSIEEIGAYPFCVQNEFVQELECVTRLTSEDPELQDDKWSDQLVRLLLAGFGKMSEEERAEKTYQHLTSCRLTNLASQGLRNGLSLSDAQGCDASDQENLEKLARDGDVLAWAELRDTDLELLNAVGKDLRTPDTVGDERPADVIDSLKDLKIVGAYLEPPTRLQHIIYEAARTGQDDLVIGALDAFSGIVDVNFQFGPHGTTLLLAAARAGNRKLCAELIDRGADPLIASSHRDIPLHWLARFAPRLKDDFDKLITIATKFMQSPQKDNTFQPLQKWAYFPRDQLLRGTPLHFAISHNSVATVRVLLTLGAQPFERFVHRPGDGEDEDGLYEDQNGRYTRTAFCHGVRLNAHDSLAAMLEIHPPYATWERNYTDENSPVCLCPGGHDPSYYCSELYLKEALNPMCRVDKMRFHGSNYQEAMIRTVDLLHSYGVRLHSAPQDHKRETVSSIFALATDWRYPWLVKDIICHLRRYSCLDPAMNLAVLAATEEPLWKAAYQGDLLMFEALYPHSRRNVLSLWKHEDKVPYLHLCAAAGHQKLELAEYMLSKPVDINMRDKMGRTALEVAILENFTEMADLLVRNGAGLDSEPIRGQVTSFGRFIQQPVLPMHCIYYFLRQRPLPNPQCWPDLNRNVLHTLAFSSRQPWYKERVQHIFEALMEHPNVYGPESLINQVDRLGFTPLMLAVFHGHLPLVQSLVKRGASVHNVDRTVTDAITIANIMKAATERQANTYKGTRKSRFAEAARKDRKAVFDLLVEHGAKLEYFFFGLPKMHVQQVIKGFRPQDVTLYAQALIQAAKRQVNSQPGTSEFRAKQAMEFYMAVMNPPDPIMILKGSALYVVTGEVDPFVKAVEPLFEDTVVPIKYVRATVEAAAGKCPFSAQSLNNLPDNPDESQTGDEPKVDMGKLQATVKNLGPAVVQILKLVPVPGITFNVIKFAITMVVQFVVKQAAEGNITGEHLLKVKRTIKEALPTTAMAAQGLGSISSEVDRMLEKMGM